MLFERTGAHENVDQNAVILVGADGMISVRRKDDDIARVKEQFLFPCKMCKSAGKDARNFKKVVSVGDGGHISRMLNGGNVLLDLKILFFRKGLAAGIFI